MFVQLQVGRVDDHPHAGQLAEFLQLGGGEGGLRRAAPPEHHDLAHHALAQLRQRVVGDVGLRQLVGVGDQDAGHVHRHIAVADDDHPLVGEIERQIAVVGVAVVPADESGRRETTGQVFAGDAHAAVGLTADGVDNLVVERLEIFMPEVGAEGHVAEVAHAPVGGDAVVDAGDGFDRLMVRRDTLAHQAERGRKAVEEIDRAGQVGLLEQRLGCVEAGRPGADDRDARRPRGGSETLFHGVMLLLP